MKAKVIIWGFVALLAVGCGGSATTKMQSTATTQQKEKETKIMTVKELTTEEFKQKVMNFEQHPDKWVFEGERPAVIDFYATWCGPCKMTAPRVQQIADKYAGQVDFYKVDVDKEEQLAALFGIQSIPSLLFIPKEGKLQMSVGAMSVAQLDSAVAGILN